MKVSVPFVILRSSGYRSKCSVNWSRLGNGIQLAQSYHRRGRIGPSHSWVSESPTFHITHPLPESGCHAVRFGSCVSGGSSSIDSKPIRKWGDCSYRWKAVSSRGSGIVQNHTCVVSYSWIDTVNIHSCLSIQSERRGYTCIIRGTRGKGRGKGKVPRCRNW